ncbi:MAG: hypothetical protein FWF79_10380 [Defluviitaleaceae bacterium]|nr:hypothetical protein [Defluviitaleaceae bacterium]
MSKFINKALLAEQLKRFWAISALAILCYVLVYLPLMGDRDSWQLIRHLVDIVSMGHFGMLFIMVLTPVAAAFCTIGGGFFNRKASTAFYALPLNKRQLFITNALAGIILSLVPVLVFCLIMLLPVDIQDGAYGSRSIPGEWPAVASSLQEHVPSVILPGGATEGAAINSFSVIGGLFLRMSVTAVFYFAVAWLAFSLAGHGFVALLIVAAMPFSIFGLLSLIEIIGPLFVFGFNSVLDTDRFTMFFVYHNPAAWGMLLRAGGELTRTQAVILPYISYIAVSAALFAGAYFISRIRKPERTGNSVMFAPVKNVLVFIFALCAMMIMGLIFYATSESVSMLYIGFIVGFVIGYVIAQMIAEKTFHVLGKIKQLPIFAGIATGLYIAVLLVTQFGFGFYVNRIPAADEIYGVFVGDRWMVSNMDEDARRHAFITDPDAIRDMQEAHQLILDNISYLREVPRLQRGTVRREDNFTWVTWRESRTFFYLLNNGRMVARHYYLPFDFIESSGIYNFLDSEAFVLSRYLPLAMPDMIMSIDLHFQTPHFFTWGGLANEGHWGFDSRRAVTITNREDIDAVMEIAARAAVANAREERQNPQWWHVPADSPPPPSVNMNIQWDRERMNERIPSGIWSWRTPHIRGEYVQMLETLLNERGIYILEPDDQNPRR